MERIKIQFADIPESSFDREHNWIVDTLRKRYIVELSDKPDFLFYGVFGHSYMNYTDCVKVFFTGELVVPNFNECDYAFSFNYLTFGDRHFRGIFGDPVADTISNIKRDIQDTKNLPDSLANRKFCNFIYSQDTVGEGAVLRKNFCARLMEYKKVDCPGLVLNNMPEGSIAQRWESGQYSSGNVDKGWNQGKIRFQSNYKFTIAFENVQADGYTTEKLVHPFLARSVPIYWGNPQVVRDFNPKAFINCNDYENMDQVIEKIIELDNDDEKYMAMLREPPMAEGYDFETEKHGREFLYRIIERGNHPFDRDPLSKDVVNQLRDDVIRAWQIIDGLKAEAASKGIVIGECMSALGVKIPLVYRAANKIYRWSQHGIGKAIKTLVKAPFTLVHKNN